MGVFVNKNKKIRSGWKIILVFAAVFGFQLVLSLIIGIVVGLFSAIRQTGYNETVAAITGFAKYITSPATILIVWLFFKFMEKKSLSQSGFTNIKESYIELIAGLLLGAISMTAIFFLLMLTGNIGISGSLLKPLYSSNVWSGLILFIFVGIEEEYLFRGYVMNALSQTKNKWVVIIVSSLIFSLAHGLNPNVSIVGLINIFLVGVLFAVMFIKTGSLWMPVGYHITWNYFQGNVFGFPVSGTAPAGMYTIVNVKDNLMTGGGFGPEGGIFTTVAIIIGLIFVMLYSRTNDHSNKVYNDIMG